MHFNYFAYCTIQEGKYYQDLLVGVNFNKIQDFIIKDEGNWKDIVKFSKIKALLDIEGNGDKRVIAHTVLFTSNNGVIMAKVSLFGRWIYEVTIGKYPLSLVQSNFGCGHIFDPFNGTAHVISPNPKSLKRPIDRSYGWFNI